MSKFEEISNTSSGATTGNNSSSESTEDIADLFRARVAALNVADSLIRSNGNTTTITNGVGPPPKPVTSTNTNSTNGNHHLHHHHHHHHLHHYSNPYSIGVGNTSGTGTGTGTGSTSVNASPTKLPPFRLCESPNQNEEPRCIFSNFIQRSNMTTAASVIKEVWRDNLYDEFVRIRKLVHKYNYIAMDTEFPGVVIWLDEDFRNSGENQFDMIRTNVDALKLIQLGISFMDENGSPPSGVSTWQFNFRFNLKTDLNAQDSIELLKESGLQFDRHQSDGIDPDDFCELFISSGLVLNPNVYWITYHGGYDFGYLMRILLGKNLPTDGDEFSQTMKVFFPSCYDVKVMLNECGNIRGGLQDISLQLGVKRIGTQHQAGSDSLLTGMTFFKIKQRYFTDSIEESIRKYNGRIYGLSLPESEDTRQQMQSVSSSNKG